VFRIRHCIFSSRAHISSWSRTRDTTSIRGLNHGWNRTIVNRVECFCRIHADSHGARACWVTGDHIELVGANFKKFLSVTPLKWELNNIKMHLSLQWRHWKANVQLAIHVKLLPSPFLCFRIIGNSVPMLFWVSLALNPKAHNARALDWEQTQLKHHNFPLHMGQHFSTTLKMALTCINHQKISRQLLPLPLDKSTERNVGAALVAS